MTMPDIAKLADLADLAEGLSEGAVAGYFRGVVQTIQGRQDDHAACEAWLHPVAIAPQL